MMNPIVRREAHKWLEQQGKSVLPDYVQELLQTLQVELAQACEARDSLQRLYHANLGDLDMLRYHLSMSQQRVRELEAQLGIPRQEDQSQPGAG